MAAGKFTEIMDPSNTTTLQSSDVRLEDILRLSEKRGRTPSETSSNASSQDSRQNSGDRSPVDSKTKQRISRLLSISKK